MRSAASGLLFGPTLRSIGGFALSEALRGCTGRLLRTLSRASSLVDPIVDDIALPPISVLPADPDQALRIYRGVFALADSVVDTRGRPVFSVAAPSPAWASALHGFDWLRHLAAADTPASRLNGRALVDDWIALDDGGHLDDIAWTPDVAARRLVSWLAAAPLLLDRSETPFRRRLLAAVSRHVRRLQHDRARCPAGLPRLRLASALLATAIAVPGLRRDRAAAARRLDDELQRQILPDGGHASRNPAAIVEALAMILPLREAMRVVGQPASPTLMMSIDRMMPMVRFFRLTASQLANFNGAAAADAGAVDAVLAFDDTLGRAHGSATYSGYQRLEAARTVVIMDCGRPPEPVLSGRAHAGTLSFELAANDAPFVVNCGVAPNASARWRAAARGTAAHSTLIVGGRSSADPVEGGILGGLLGPVLLGGPSRVNAERREHDGAVAVVADHDGYQAAFGLVHERTLRLAPRGDRLDGRDRLSVAAVGGDGGPPKLASPVDYDIRFHLAPGIEAIQLDNGVVMLIDPQGETWEFHADDSRPSVTASVYMGGRNGPQPTSQIVLTGNARSLPEQRWTFVRTAAAHAQRAP